MNEGREQFLKTYANLPLNLRKEIIVVVDKEPMTWNAAYIEVLNNTPKGAAVLKNLRSLHLL